MALVKYYYDPSEPNGAYDENTLAGCVGGGEGYEKVDTNSSDDIYLCIDGIPAGATITNISASFTCKNLTWMNEDWAVIIKYKTTVNCIPVILQNPSFSGNKITSLGSVSTFGNSTTLCSKSHLFNTTSKSINQSGNKSLPSNSIVGLKFSISNNVGYGDIHFWLSGVNITVTYSMPTHTITVNSSPTNGGTVTGGGTYNRGSTATLTATPNRGYWFVQWDDNNTDNPRSVTVTGNATYTAYFNGLPYRLRYIGNGHTSGSMGITPYKYNFETYKLDKCKYKKDGHTFMGWATSANGSVVYADEATVGNGIWTESTDAPIIDLYAVWKVNSYTLTVTAGEGGSVSGGGNYNYGATATLKATPNTGYKFVKWSDGNTSATRTVTVTGAATYTATFEKLTYTISTAVTPTGGGTVTGGGTYEHGATATLTATPATGYKFKCWQDNTSLTNATRTVTVTGTATYTATFEKLKYTVTWKNHDGTTLETDTNVEYGTTPSYNGATPTKASTAQHAYTFSGWSPSVSAVTGNVTYTAQFTATVRKYTVKWYNYDGTLLETDTDVPYGTKPTYNGATPTKPSDDYYTYGFAGWSPSTDEAIQGDKNFTAQFAQTDRYYTVRWVNASAVQGVEGELLETDEVKFNTQPDYNGAIPKHPKQDSDPAFNYDFIGWSAKVTDPAKPDTELEKVKGNITYTAIYETTPKLYAITVILFDSQSTDIYEYGTEVTIEAPEIVDFHRFIKWSDGDTRCSRPITVTGVATYQAVYERIPVPVKVNKEQVTGCYIVPTTKTIVYVISGTVPTVETKRESVDGWSFLVSNSIPENGYPLKKLFITDNGVTTRVY